MRKHLPFQRSSSRLLAILAAGLLMSPIAAFAEEAANAGTGMDCSDPACAELCAAAKAGMEEQLKATTSTIKPLTSVASADKSCFGSISLKQNYELQAPKFDGQALLDSLKDMACNTANDMLGNITDSINDIASLSSLDVGNLGSSGLGNIFSGNSNAVDNWLKNSVSTLPTSPIIKASVTRSVRTAPASTQGTGVTNTTDTTTSTTGTKPAQQNDLINLFR